MNLFKHGPILPFQIIVALLTVVFTGVLVAYFTYDDVIKIFGSDVSSDKPTTFLSDQAVVEKKSINVDAFGVLHAEVDAPSFAQSNFDVDPNTNITLYFNGLVDERDFLSKFSLIDSFTGESVAIDYIVEERGDTEDTDEKYTYAWQKHWQQKVVVTPDEVLFPLTTYKVVILSGVYNEDRSKVSKNRFEFDFMTADFPALHSDNIGGDPIKVGDIIRLTFRVPMKTSDLDEMIRILPDDNAFTLTNHDKIVQIEAELDAGAYELEIPGDVTDIYGRKLDDDILIEFTVQ